uniref:Stalled ribosome sensor GCN1-like N-terminal domain-containing protein n=1 Tax=Latimeria chalumnae TaxID=7897 RepID=M3XH46_LATCH
MTKNLMQCLYSAGIFSKNGVPSKSSSAAACLALRWTCLLVRTGFAASEKRQGDNWKKMVELQCSLLTEVLGSSRRHAVDTAVAKLKQLWKEYPNLHAEYMSTALSLEPNQSYLGMLGIVVQFCSTQKDLTTVNKHQSALVELFVKTVLMSKTKPQKHILDNCVPLLRHFTHQDFKETVLPTLQKSLLRSPENVIETISCLLSSVTLDLSQYAMDIGKGLSSQLKSNNNQLMDEAVSALKSLAHQCSDPSAMESLCRHLFAILGGSEGKLTVVAQKMSVLSGISSLSNHAVSGPSSQALSGIVSDLFIPFLQQEVHEGTLVHAVSVLSLWSSKFTTEIPKTLLEWMKKAFSLKACTSAVRHAYLQCMLAAIRGDTLLQGVEMLPLLIQTVEKAAAQVIQIPLVTEGVAASVLICRMAVADPQVESKLAGFWQLVLDEKKQIFTSEKFLSLASEEGEFRRSQNILHLPYKPHWCGL